MGTAAGHSCSRHNRLTAFRRLITTGRPRPVHPPSPPSSLSPATHCVRANAPPSLHDDHPHPPCRRRQNAARCLPSRRRRCSKYCVRSGPPRPTPRPHHPLGSGRLAHSRPPPPPTYHGVGPGLRGPTALPPTTSHFGAAGQARARWRLPDAAAGGVATIGCGASLIDASGPAESGFGHEHRYQGEVI